MRTFTHGSGSARKIVAIEVKGSRMRMLQKGSDGTMKRSEKDLNSESDARAACEKMARELVSRGFVEQAAPAGAGASAGAKPATPKPKAAAPAEDDGLYAVFEDEEPPAPAEPVLPRMNNAPASAASRVDEPKAKGKDKDPDKKKKKKKKKKAGNDDSLDKRVLGAIGALVFLVVCGVGYVAYDTFLKPPTVIGYWSGTNTEYEIGGPIIRISYKLSLDEKKQAEMLFQDEMKSVGTYKLKGDRLILNLKDQDEDGQWGPAYDKEFKIKLGRTTMDLYEPGSKKLLVQLVRYKDKPEIGGAGGAQAKKEAGADLKVGALAEPDEAADARLASVEFAVKDGAFRCRHPQGWEVTTGSRPDNTWSWAKFTKGNAQIHVIADIAGSLMAGANNSDHEEGSELAPVHRAHELGKKSASEDYNDYNEGKPELFKGSRLGEGRIAAFSASTGLLGSKIRGYRVTLLTNDRRVTVLCHCPVADLAKLKPTFVAVCRSLQR